MTDKQYQTINGTSYDARTPRHVCAILETCRNNGTRIRVHHGNTTEERGPLGRDWLEENDVEGRVGRSTGTIKIPLIIHNARSMGGPGLLDHCIVRIRTTGKYSRDLYRHPQYHTGTITMQPCAMHNGGELLTVEVLRDGAVEARFTDEGNARRWIRKMGLELAQTASA